jgi:hypothetical protein
MWRGRGGGGCITCNDDAGGRNEWRLLSAFTWYLMHGELSSLDLAFICEGKLFQNCFPSAKDVPSILAIHHRAGRSAMHTVRAAACV